MFQQQENIDFLTQRVDFECRFCFVSTIERANLKYDIVNKSRYYYETMRMRKEMSSIFAKTR